jgi:hypothetical protein
LVNYALEDIMSSEVTPDLVSYHAFVKATLARGGSVDEDASPQAYLEYQAELERLRRELQPAALRLERGEPAHEVDFDALVALVLTSGRRAEKDD